MWRNEQLRSISAATSPPVPNNSKVDVTSAPPRKPGSKGPGRKRTKSGCMTCRGRRIKCGEERPICQNCTKSKRQCGGYEQKIVFKDNYQPASTSSKLSVTFAEPILGEPPVRQGKPKTRARIQAESISKSMASDPTLLVQNPHQLSEATSNSYTPLTFVPEEQSSYTPHGSTHDNPPNMQEPETSFAPQYHVKIDKVDPPRLSEARQYGAPKEQALHYDFEAVPALVKIERMEQAPHLSTVTIPLNWSAGPSSEYFPTYSAAQWTPNNTVFSFENATPLYQGELGTIQGAFDPSKASLVQQATRHHETSLTMVSYTPRSTDVNSNTTSSFIQPQRSTHKAKKGYHFFESDDDAVPEEPWPANMQINHFHNTDLNAEVAFPTNQDHQGLNYRPYASPIDHSHTPATYIPSSQATPMPDPATALTFYHFEPPSVNPNNIHGSTNFPN